MKTEQLIDLLSTNLEAVDTHRVIRSLWIAIVTGLVLASLTCIVTLGIRPDLSNPGVLEFLFVKIGFASRRQRPRLAPPAQATRALVGENRSQNISNRSSFYRFGDPCRS